MTELSPNAGSLKLFGMENFGNTCYCNSILQCLFYTKKFRHLLLSYNVVSHEPYTSVPGANPHVYTTKYEQLLAKRLKEQGKPLVPAENGGTGATGPVRPSLRNSLFGKFGNSTQNIHSEDHILNTTYRKLGYILEAAQCPSLTIEQQLIIKKNKDFHGLELLVTRPSIAATPANSSDNSTAATALLDLNVAQMSSPLDPGPVTTRSNYIAVGIPHPEPGLALPINPFLPNPSVDQRKRSALVNGPIVNLDSLISPNSGTLSELAFLYALQDMFAGMVESDSQIGVVSPLFFVNKLKERNYLFRQANMHHDAHEFCNYMINEIIETLNIETSQKQNWCTDIFQGLITNETKCLYCETVTSKDETFLDLSIDVPSGESAYSLTFSLNNFSKLETLNHQNKFYCNTCRSLQEAVKTIKLKKTPEVLVINFKRFKYDDKIDSMVKLFDSILYPMRLRLFNTTTSGNNASKSDGFSLYGLYALVIHIGGGPTHGHYVALCKNEAGLWFLFDDETVELVDEWYVLRFFGNGPGLATAYMLFYEKLDTAMQEDGLDFGIDVNGLYNGDDYSVATEATPGVFSNSINPVSVGTPDTVHSHSHFQDQSDTLATKGESYPKKSNAPDHIDPIGDTVSRSSTRGTKDIHPETPKSEKKSWVTGLKRREGKTDPPKIDRKASVSSIRTEASTATTGTEDAPEKPRRMSSIFGFKRRS
ncbi:hypothetical protein PUMCH_001801 [Australozyma saopauloensis]|uniref:Ubiquitin carboxyl-terminal hydrolase n=1 Tax=Australozyma saopauloensis TaxID=291208 RepID=A0AAX4H9Z5_9ASCO|nr:hypothetical protein PUMCH_001801 [[Candida] saopauloensis]